METLIKLSKPTILISGVMLLAYASMKIVTPTSDFTSTMSVEEKRAREIHTAQMMRYLEANARSDNPIWKVPPPPRMPTFAPKEDVHPKAQLELNERNKELKKRSDESKKRRSIRHSSSSDKMMKDIEATKLD
ncbi:hypothetical protein LOD99_7779 [Oopsacas minuta]|uniref:Uncharacterized protein n=1 Tax=Oopsacas minuta TaxID=111878 RepID=A0AAV7JP28_9METZ|nr:hypothetical protein LOD99_7779 [Oopsacas minuta]